MWRRVKVLLTYCVDRALPLLTMSTVLATQVRKHTTARPTRAAGRYWKGKAPKGAAEVPSDSEEEQEQEQEREEGDVSIGGEGDFVKEEEEEEEESLPTRSTQAKSARALNVSLKDVSISRDGKVIVAGREESGRTLMEEGVSRNVHALLFSYQSCHVEESEELEEAQAQVEEEEEEASFRTYACSLWLTMLLSRARRSPSRKKKKKTPNYCSDLYLSQSTLPLTRRSLAC